MSAETQTPTDDPQTSDRRSLRRTYPLRTRISRGP